MSQPSAAAPAKTATNDKPSPPPRVIIQAVEPVVDAGRFAIKRIVGEPVRLSADIFTEGHDLLCSVGKSRPAGDKTWRECPLESIGNDRWTGKFSPDKQGWWEYTVEAWVDEFTTWRQALVKKYEAAQEIAVELLEGAQLIRAASQRATNPDRSWLNDRAKVLASNSSVAERVAAALDAELATRMRRFADRGSSTVFEPWLRIQVERPRARFGAWYEFFPRSTSGKPGVHGTFRDAEAALPYVASMGFDVVYLPPIHPIGRAFRKGPNNSLQCGPNDPGSPWAIGAAEGGHTATLPALGSLADFDNLVAKARALNLEIALDIAFQCAPDHPWVAEHPTWFKQRPDGTIQYAENPPKKYQDIYPLNFQSPDWRGLWEALRDVFLFWINHGVSIFRVDNPHTKAFPFWEWCLREVWDRHPDAIFLSEAFTRPKVMKYLAKLGFTQSYTYFTWRNDKQGLTEYFQELTQSECAEYLRPNLFANTPDILHEYLQSGGRPAFMTRLILAATLGASYGVYGPPFELCDGTPVRHGSEEYLDSEKYQLRTWNLDAPWSLRPLITTVNAIRRENEALHDNRNLRFYQTDNPQIIAYGKTAPDQSNIVITIVNLDPHHTQSGWVTLPIGDWGLDPHSNPEYRVHDMLDDARYSWRGPTNFVLLDPHKCPAHILRLER